MPDAYDLADWLADALDAIPDDDDTPDDGDADDRPTRDGAITESSTRFLLVAPPDDHPELAVHTHRRLRGR